MDWRTVFLPPYAFSRLLLRRTTDCERQLWRSMRPRKLGYEVLRQVPIGPYTADFFFPTRRVVLEVDGSSHSGREEYDDRRDRVMRESGIRVVRVTNEAVVRDLPGVLKLVRSVLAIPRTRRNRIAPETVRLA